MKKLEFTVYHVFDNLKNLDNTTSCQYISCDFGATFPSEKYKDHECFLQKYVNNVHNVLILIEPPGTGK